MGNNHGLYIGYYTLWATCLIPIIVWENSPDLDETYDVGLTGDDARGQWACAWLARRQDDAKIIDKW
jgi:hypothetical protein